MSCFIIKKAQTWGALNLLWEASKGSLKPQVNNLTLKGFLNGWQQKSHTLSICNRKCSINVHYYYLLLLFVEHYTCHMVYSKNTGSWVIAKGSLKDISAQCLNLAICHCHSNPTPPHSPCGLGGLPDLSKPVLEKILPFCCLTSLETQNVMDFSWTPPDVFPTEEASNLLKTLVATGTDGVQMRCAFLQACQELCSVRNPVSLCLHLSSCFNILHFIFEMSLGILF